MSDFLHYMAAQEKARTAFAEYNSASRGLENARIHERLAEIKSQHEPLASLLDEKLSERERLYASAFYVVFGRMPTKESQR
jgi:hypothetical protein